jgi:dihydroflavonol-4-reductase
VAALTASMAAADAVIHAAGSYRVGLRPCERPAMWDANVGTTERVLDAAQAAGVPRVVYVSTNNVLGDTHGTKPDETYRRPAGEGFLSWYDETKVRAHDAAEERIAAGAPIVIVQPAQMYGPHDHSEASAQLALAHAGRLPYVALGDLGLAWVHVDDVAEAIVAALERGRVGDAYSLAGDCRRMSESVAVAARIGGHRPPRLAVPTALLRAVAPLNDRVGHLPGLPAGLGEILSASDGVTYWATHDKATRELGFAPRSLEQGITDTWGAAT